MAKDLTQLLNDLEVECNPAMVDPSTPKRDRSSMRSLVQQIYDLDPVRFDSDFGTGTFARWLNTIDRCKFLERCLTIVDSMRSNKKRGQVTTRKFVNNYGWQSDYTTEQGSLDRKK